MIPQVGNPLERGSMNGKSTQGVPHMEAKAFLIEIHQLKQL